MDLKEIINLIKVRDYVANSINNSSIDRSTVSELNGMLILLDKKIINNLKSSEFKDYICFGEVKKTIEEIAKQNNIRSGLKK